MQPYIIFSLDQIINQLIIRFVGVYGLIYFNSFMKTSFARMIKNAIKTIIAITLSFDKFSKFDVGSNCSQRTGIAEVQEIEFRQPRLTAAE